MIDNRKGTRCLFGALPPSCVQEQDFCMVSGLFHTVCVQVCMFSETLRCSAQESHTKRLFLFLAIVLALV